MKGREEIRKALLDQKLGFYISYQRGDYQMHAVDRFALYPLFYVASKGQLYVSGVVDELLHLLPRKILHPIGYYSTGGIGKGSRSHYSPYKGIMRIPPGHFIEYKNGRLEIIKYWTFTDMTDKPFEGSYDDACDTLGLLIKQAVERCYAYEPNVAAHMSGGFDSGSIVALLAQVKSDPIHSYMHVKPDAPDIAPADQPYLENAFVKKYQDFYPHISVYKSHALPFDLPQSVSAPGSAGNWHHVQHHSPEGKICQDMTQKNIKYILSGVGGDELASYGHSHQSSNKMVNNDAELNRFLYNNIFLKRRVKFLVKGMLGMDGPRIDAIVSSLISRPLHKSYLDYHPEFRKHVPALDNYEQMALYWAPSSYEYRLEMLDRSNLSVRSDIWNYLSHSYGIDYVFPLLESDLVEFCASIPRAFFIGKPQRNMFKRGLAKYLPQELLQGGKRPGYQPSGPAKDVITDEMSIQKMIQDIMQLKHTLAASVYDLDYAVSRLHKIGHRLDKWPRKWYTTKQVLLREATRMHNYLLQEAGYINTHYDDIDRLNTL